ncbi:MAG: hypothetical protein IKE30_06175, partial [Clostridia bacterium]|nr:hypothetical protein [Clostridia bacterium]
MKRAAARIGLVLALIFLIVGVRTRIPDKYIRSWGEGRMTEYVGGDAYNFIIEASLRGGEIAGAYASKALYLGFSGILFVLSLSLMSSDPKRKSAAEEGKEAAAGAPSPAESTEAESAAAEDTAAEVPAAEDTAAEDTAAEDTAAEDTAAEVPAAEDTAAEVPATEDTAGEDTA